jgi:hypothetical protein
MPLNGTVDDCVVGTQKLVSDRDAVSHCQDRNILELHCENRAKSGILENRCPGLTGYFRRYWVADTAEECLNELTVYLDDSVRNQAVRFLVHSRDGLRIRCLDQTERYRPRFIEPVGQCSAIVFGLDSKILLVSYRNVGRSRAGNVVTVHENRHQPLLVKDQDAKSTSWYSTL